MYEIWSKNCQKVADKWSENGRKMREKMSKTCRKMVQILLKNSRKNSQNGRKIVLKWLEIVGKWSKKWPDK